MINNLSIKKYFLRNRLIKLFIFSVLIVSSVFGTSVYATSQVISSWLPDLGSIKNYLTDDKPVQPILNDNLELKSDTISDKSLLLNGKGFVEINSKNEQQMQSLTIESWIKYVGTDKAQGIIQITNEEAEIIKLEILKDSTLEFSLSDSSNVHVVNSKENISPDEWHHFALVFNEGSISIFVDGHLSNQKEINNNSLRLGRNIKIGLTGEKANKKYFNGLIDELRIANFVKYNQQPYTDKKSLGALLDNSYLGLWRFENSDLTDFSSDRNNGSIIGKAWFSDDTYDQSSKNELLASSYCGTTPITNSICRDFDELPPFYNLDTVYNDVVFFSTAPFTNFWNANSGNAGMSQPYSANAWDRQYQRYNYYAPLTIQFAGPVDNLSFRILGLDSAAVGYAQVQITQQNGVITNSYLSSYGYNVPVDYYIGLANCGNSPCDRITKIVIYNITDNLGISYDNFSYTPSPVTPTPTPTITPTPTPTPTPVAVPTNFVVKAEIGKVRITWQPGQNGDQATSYRLYRTNQNGEQLLSTIISPLEYVDKDVKIKHNYLYKVVGVKDSRTSSPAGPIAQAPLSPCDQYPSMLAPDLGLPDVIFSGVNGWSGTFSKGLNVGNVKLNGRMLASYMNAAQYINVKTNKMAAPQRINLYQRESENQSITNGEFVSKAIGYSKSNTFDPQVTLSSDYCVSSPSGQAMWLFSIKYIFGKTLPKDQCEPSATLSCARFFPLSSYKYESPEEFNEVSESVEVVQKLNYQENEKPNSVGLFQDCEDYLNIAPGNNLNYKCNLLAFPFSGYSNPVPNETSALVIRHGLINYSWDNIHTTSKPKVLEPSPQTFRPAGCPECVHDHWRWSGASSLIVPGSPLDSLPLPIFSGNVLQFRNGEPLIGWDYYNRVPQSQYHRINQDVEIGVVRTGAGPFELDPINFRTLINDESLQNYANSALNLNEFSSFWYAGLSKEPNIVSQGKNTATDLFHAHGGFFNPSYIHVQSLIENKSAGLGSKFKDSKRYKNVVIDGPVSVIFEHVYQEGITTFSPTDLSSIVLPPKYTALSSTGHNIETSAVISGSHIVSFKVESVSSPEIFGNLRILQAQFNEFNPLVPKWIDVTILPPNPQSPDFSTRTINAKVENLGKFIIAVINPNLPVATTNLKVELDSSPNPVRSDNNLIYNLTVSNVGTSTANSVIAMQILPPNVQFVSATPSQGNCSLGIEEDDRSEHSSIENTNRHDLAISENRVYCQLGVMQGNSSLTISIVVIPTEGENTFPSTGINVSSTAMVSMEEYDTDVTDNIVEKTTLVLPSLNAKPLVEITSPVSEQTFVSSITNPTPIEIVAAASDTDGNITKVEIFDNGMLAGVANTIGGNQYKLTINQLAYGYHNLVAMATDNGGRVSTSANVVVIINGTANLIITNPLGVNFQTNQDIVIETSSNIPANRIKKIELFSSGEKLGTLSQVSVAGNIYKHKFLWKSPPRGKPVLTAVLTEYSGAVTISNSLFLTISNAPSVVISTPSDGLTYQQASVIPINVQLDGSGGYVEKVDYYVNGNLIGTTTGNISSGTSNFNWQNPPEGIYSLFVVATNDLGIATTSSTVTFGVNRPGAVNGELIWVDDQIPTGATIGGNDGWNWLGINPAALLGSIAHQSMLINGQHEHYFENAVQKLPVNTNEKLTAWIFIDPDFVPSEIMLQFNDGQNWEHRAYWGDNLINLGTNETVSRKRIENIPVSGRWIQLVVPASLVGLEGKQVSGIKFTLYNGRAAWDRIGKLAASAQPQPPLGDFVWIDDEPPSGSILETVNDTWTDGTWINNLHYSGNLAHRHYEQATNVEYRQHAFKNPINSMIVNPGDTLFTYVYLNPDPQYRPDTLVLQWFDDVSGWEHRAYWGADMRPFTGSVFSNLPANYEGWRYMGPVIYLGGWVRLEIPASYVGLEGKNVKGMSFGIYQKNKKGRAVWDYSGKTSIGVTTQIAPLKFTSAIWRNGISNGRINYSLNKDLNYFESTTYAPGANSGYIYSYQAPGTIPLYLYTLNNTSALDVCATNCFTGWTRVGVIGYTFPVSGTPDTTKYNLHSCNNNFYYTSQPQPPDPIPVPSGCTPQPGNFSGYVHTH